MEKDKSYKEIELRCEEVQEVMNQIPHAILRYGITVLFFIICILLTGSLVFSYPEIVETDFILSTQNSPAYLISKKDGRIERLYVSNRQIIHKDDYIAVIENIAKTEEIFYLQKKLSFWRQTGSRVEQIGNLFFRHVPQLGSVQTAYSSCLLAWNNYLQHMQENRIYETELINTVALLATAIAEWEDNYLLAAPIAGTVAYMQLWKENQNVVAGETMFVIVPTGNFAPVGKALLPMQGVGKVQTGQRVIIRLEGFSEQEFGFLEGKVISISPVPDKNGKFILEIDLIKGVKTNYGKELPVMKIMTGTANIITKEKSLFERLIKHWK